MRIHALTHVPYEGLSNVRTWADERKCEVTTSHLWEGGRFPSHEEYDFLVVMGGPMGSYDEDRFSWLASEKRFIGEAIKANRSVLGICLGSQLLAEVLGGRVFPHREQEIGWYPVSLTEAGTKSPLFKGIEKEFFALHWHGDTFELSPRCVHLAESECCAQQAFSYGSRVLGLQFHLELSLEDAEKLAAADALELKRGRCIQSFEAIASERERFYQAQRLLFTVLDNLVGY